MKRTMVSMVCLLMALLLIFCLASCAEKPKGAEQPSQNESSSLSESDGQSPSTPPDPSGCDHTWVNADCDTPRTCSACGETEGEALGHSTGAAGDRAATCSTRAYCSVCQSEYGEALGHSTGAVGDRAATCSTRAYCSVCQSEYGEALGHSTGAAGDRAATCNARAYCSVCQSEYGEFDADAHNMADATCEEPSTCLNGCGHTEGSALGHSTGAAGDRAATCSTRAYCSVCQSEYGEFDADAHDMADATCEDPSTCKNGCGHTVGNALGHSYGEWVTTKAPTKTEAGEKQQTCGTCGGVNTEEIPAGYQDDSDEPFKGGDIIIIG